MDNFDLQMIPKRSQEDQDVQDCFVQDVAAEAPPEAPVAALADGPCGGGGCSSFEPGDGVELKSAFKRWHRMASSFPNLHEVVKLGLTEFREGTKKDAGMSFPGSLRYVGYEIQCLEAPTF